MKPGYIELKESNAAKLNIFYERYPDFDIVKFEADAKSAYVEMCTFLQENKLDELENCCTEGFVANRMFDDVEYKDLDVSNIYNSCKIEYIGYSPENDDIYILMNCNFKLREYNNLTGIEIKSLTRKIQKRYAMNLINKKRVKRDITHCYNCGAPLKNLFGTSCEFCGTFIGKAYEWLISDISKP